MKAPTQEQLNDPEWWNENDPVGECNRLFLVWEDGRLKRIQWMRGASMFKREGSMEVPELHHRPTKPAAPEWVDGLPPVGSEIEVWFNSAGAGYWEKAVVVFWDGRTMVVRVNGEYYGRTELSLVRPIRTKEQRDREDLANFLNDYVIPGGFDGNFEECLDYAGVIVSKFELVRKEE